MKKIYSVILTLLWLSTPIISTAQLFINGDVIVQSGVNLYSTDTIRMGSNGTIANYGIVQSSVGINTNGIPIYTLNGGSIISPVQTGIAKSFDIGANSNNKIQITHTTGATVNFQIGVDNNVFLNPVTKATQITNNVVNKTWYIQPLSNSNNTQISTFWNSADESTGFSRSLCAVSKWQQSSSTAWSYNAPTSIATSTGSTPSYYQTINMGNMVAAIYYFGVGGNSSSLPVQLMSFDAFKNNEDGKLSWITSSETNNSHFDILRSIDKINWENIGLLKGSGNSNVTINYAFLDEKPFIATASNKVYYRLRQVDLDGKYTVSEIRMIEDDSDVQNANISLYPNPFNNQITIKIGNSEITSFKYSIINILGKSILSNVETVQPNQLVNLNLDNLSSGIYFISINADNSNSSTFKLIKQ